LFGLRGCLVKGDTLLKACLAQGMLGSVKLPLQNQTFSQKSSRAFIGHGIAAK
jgi:hypothetical protein